jgi:hypothetical protein
MNDPICLIVTRRQRVAYSQKNGRELCALTMPSFLSRGTPPDSGTRETNHIRMKLFRRESRFQDRARLQSDRACHRVHEPPTPWSSSEIS